VLSSSWDGRSFGLNRHWPKTGGLCPLLKGELGPHLTQCGLGQGLPPYQVASLFTSHLATNDMGQKLGAMALWGRGAAFLFDTMCQGPRPTSVPSFILIHATVWPQYTNVTDRQCSDSIGRTVLQTITQKMFLLECGPMPNVMSALPNIGGALCSTLQSLSIAYYQSAVQ